MAAIDGNGVSDCDVCERSACEYVNITLTNRWCAEHALRHNERHRFVYNTFCHFFNKMRTYTIISSPFWGTAVNCGHTERNVPDHSVRTRIAGGGDDRCDGCATVGCSHFGGVRWSPFG